jgi:hypothetical protein
MLILFTFECNLGSGQLSWYCKGLWPGFFFYSWQRKDFSLLHGPTHPACWILRALFQGVKRPGYEAEVKNGGAIPPLPLMSSWHSA